MNASGDLEAKLNERRRDAGVRRSLEVLDGIGITRDDARVLREDELDGVWQRYIDRTKHESTECLSPGEIENLQKHLDGIAADIGSLRGIWFAYTGGVIVGIEVPIAPLLLAATGYFVSRGAGLMISEGQEVASGINVELEQVSAGQRFEIVAWGEFDRGSEA